MNIVTINFNVLRSFIKYEIRSNVHDNLIITKNYHWSNA